MDNETKLSLETKESARCPAQIVVGADAYARALAQVLGAPLLEMILEAGKDERTFDYPDGCDSPSLLLVLSSADTGSTLARRHRAIWRMVGVRRLKWVVVAESKLQAEEARKQDVYGRLNGGETFGKWADRYAIVTRQQGLMSIAQSSNRLKAMWRSTWERHDAGIQALVELQRRISEALLKKLSLGRHELVQNLPHLVWECFCGHAQANKIRDWLARDENCHAWLEEGKRLIAQLISENRV
jgi:hypothetical protein